MQSSMLKFIFCGASGVGKTSVILRFTKDSFFENVNSTIGVDILVKKVEANGQIYKLALTDTAGQERFKAMSNLYFRGCKAIIFVYSIDSRQSFDDVNGWIETARQNSDNPNFVGCIIGNKLDLESRRQVNYEEGLELAQRHNFIFLEVSAKAKVGIDEVFEDILNVVIQQQQEVEMEKMMHHFQLDQHGLSDGNNNGQNSNTVDLTASDESANAGGGGCC